MRITILITVVALFVVFFLFNFDWSQELSKRSRIFWVAILLVLAGSIFGNSPWLAYSLIAAGVILAIIVDVLTNEGK